MRFITPEMLKNPRYQPSATPPPRPSGPAYSPFCNSPDCQDIPDYAILNPKDGMVAGLVADRPGKLWKYMTGHLQKLQSPISKSYFDTIEYVKVPAIWSSIMNQHQLQCALASVSEKWVNRNWSDSDHREFPDGAASAVAVISYVTRTLQILICESSMFKDNLMWDPKHQSCV